jgi:hypothetical protein
MVHKLTQVSILVALRWCLVRPCAVIALSLTACRFSPSPVELAEDAPAVADGAADGAAPDARPDGAADAPFDVSLARDADFPVLLREAEDPDSMDATGSHSWSPASDLPGFSGSGFLEASPDIGFGCTSPAVLSTCAPSLTYDFLIPEDNTWFFWARMLSVDGNEDSLWYQIDGNLDPTPINQTEDGTWKWELGSGRALAPGTHVLTIWMREDGARLDMVALSPDTSPPI